MGVRSGRDAIDAATEPLLARNIIHVERGGLFRIRERTVLRYYARTIQHLVAGGRPMLLRIPGDASTASWHARLALSGPVRVCGLG